MKKDLTCEKKNPTTWDFGFHKTTKALTDAGATVICYHETIGAVTGASLRRRVAEILTAQGGAAVQACEQKKKKKKSNHHHKADYSFTQIIHF